MNKCKTAYATGTQTDAKNRPQAEYLSNRINSFAVYQCASLFVRSCRILSFPNGIYFADMINCLKIKLKWRC